MKSFILFLLTAVMISTVSFASPPDIPKPDIVKIEKATPEFENCFVYAVTNIQTFAVDVGFTLDGYSTLPPAPLVGIAVECKQVKILPGRRSIPDIRNDHQCRSIAFQPYKKFGSREGTAILLKNVRSGR